MADISWRFWRYLSVFFCLLITVVTLASGVYEVLSDNVDGATDLFGISAAMLIAALLIIGKIRLPWSLLAEHGKALAQRAGAGTEDHATQDSGQRIRQDYPGALPDPPPDKVSSLDSSQEPHVQSDKASEDGLQYELPDLGVKVFMPYGAVLLDGAVITAEGELDSALQQDINVFSAMAMGPLLRGQLEKVIKRKDYQTVQRAFDEYLRIKKSGLPQAGGAGAAVLKIKSILEG
ncbi:MAG: hypothetical protein KJ626_05310 [Verrucomicrobia bacterium]|nr:hypothetical protein [Verrucomicrobiota bacterium]